MTSVIDICRIPETVPSNIIMSSQPRSWFKTPFAFHPAHQNTLTTARRRQFATPEISHHKEPRNIFSKICFQDISILQEYWTWDICHKMGNKVKLTNLLQSRLPRKFKVFPSEILSVSLGNFKCFQKNHKYINWEKFEKIVFSLFNIWRNKWYEEAN